MFLFQAGGLEESAVTGIVVGALLGAGLLMAFYFFRLGLLYKVLKFTLLNCLCHLPLHDPPCDLSISCSYPKNEGVKRAKPSLVWLWFGGQGVSIPGSGAGFLLHPTVGHRAIAVFCSQIFWPEFLPPTTCISGDRIWTKGKSTSPFSGFLQFRNRWSVHLLERGKWLWAVHTLRRSVLSLWEPICFVTTVVEPWVL